MSHAERLVKLKAFLCCASGDEVRVLLQIVEALQKHRNRYGALRVTVDLATELSAALVARGGVR